MSRVDSPLTREPVDLHARGVTAKRRAKIIARDQRCKYPDCQVTTGLEVDHIIALALGGKDSDDNLECLCADHHAQKTRRDVGLIAKARRLRLTHTGQKPPPTQKLKGRGFRKRWNDFGDHNHD